ncbi:hypothetical protein [Zunongwangia sp. H14]|uniref:hypothetical protein n=1 Tax=Zunongwangia sp. H14 TaxID=3240792 RepID=UPI0035626DF0
MKKISLLILASILLASCSYRITDFTIISTKNVDLSRAGSFTRAKARNEGVDKIHIILWIPFGRPHLKEAIDRAIEATPGAVALVDGVVYSKSWWAILYGQSKIVVEGTPLVDPSLASTQKMPEYSIAKLDNNGEVKEIVEISKEEYSKMKSEISRDMTAKQFRSTSEL